MASDKKEMEKAGQEYKTVAEEGGKLLKYNEMDDFLSDADTDKLYPKEKINPKSGGPGVCCSIVHPSPCLCA